MTTKCRSNYYKHLEDHWFLNNSSALIFGIHFKVTPLFSKSGGTEWTMTYGQWPWLQKVDPISQPTCRRLP